MSTNEELHTHITISLKEIIDTTPPYEDELGFSGASHCILAGSLITPRIFLVSQDCVRHENCWSTLLRTVTGGHWESASQVSPVSSC
jgi:hypothetical protein